MASWLKIRGREIISRVEAPDRDTALAKFIVRSGERVVSEASYNLDGAPLMTPTREASPRPKADRPLTPKQRKARWDATHRAERNEYQRRRRASLTPEEYEAKKAKERMYGRKCYAKHHPNAKPRPWARKD